MYIVFLIGGRQERRWGFEKGEHMSRRGRRRRMMKGGGEGGRERRERRGRKGECMSRRRESVCSGRRGRRIMMRGGEVTTRNVSRGVGAVEEGEAAAAEAVVYTEAAEAVPWEGCQSQREMVSDTHRLVQPTQNPSRNMAWTEGKP